jgi:PAS domain S-box-containing protein
MKAFALGPLRHFKLTLVSVVASLGVCLSVPLLLIGWWLHLPRLTRIVEFLPTTTPLPVVGFLFVGLALTLVRRRLRGRTRQNWARFLGCLSGLAGALILLEYFAGAALVVNRQLAAVLGSSDLSAGAWHDSILAGVMLLLLGLALVLLDMQVRPNLQATHFLAIVVANIVVLALVGYVFSYRNLYILHPALDPGLSLPCALMAGMLALGILCARPGKGFMGLLTSAGGGGVLARRLLLFPAVLPVLFTTASTLLQRAGVLSKEIGGWLALIGYLTTFLCVIWWVGTKVMRAEQERDREEHHFWAVAETAVVGIVTIEANGTIVYANATAEHLFGYVSGALAGKGLQELLPACAEAVGAKTLGAFLNEQQEKSKDRMIHIAGRHHDGSTFPTELSVSSWGAGTQHFMTAIVSDITERALRERRMNQLNNDLVEANRELEAFSYSVSHDLRAPLRAIDGFSRILLEECGPGLQEDHQVYLQDVRQNAQQMGQLIDALLSFARLSRQPLKKHSVQMAELVRECLEILDSAERAEQPRVVVGELPACEGDRSLLKQVWQNLIDNALKYSRHRQPALIEIGCTATGPDKIPAYFVRDNGTGFDMKYAGKLFGVFQRLHRSDEFEGSGVGLAMVERILHRHGGRIWAEAKPNEGATFYFTVGDDISLS